MAQDGFLFLCQRFPLKMEVLEQMLLVILVYQEHLVPQEHLLTEILSAVRPAPVNPDYLHILGQVEQVYLVYQDKMVNLEHKDLLVEMDRLDYLVYQVD